MADSLFPSDDRNDYPRSPTELPTADAVPSRPRLRLPQRHQSQMFTESLDQRLDDDHPVRTIWQFVQQLDLSRFLQPIKAVQGHVGRDHTDPQLLVALWLFATSEGVGSARRLDALCRQHRAYEWLCGGVSVNYHLLADFRTAHGDLLDDLLAQSLAALSHEGLLDVNVVAIDGMRTRASAGTDSFRRQATLEKHRQDAQQQLVNLKRELELQPQQLSQRQRQARLRAARERTERLDQALENVEDLAQKRERRQRGSGAEARISTTDPECRKMKMPDGGYRPAYNVQFGTEVASGLIVGVAVSNTGTDANELGPMLENVKENTGQAPKTALIDGGYYSRENLAAAERSGTTAYVPLKNEKKDREEGRNPYEAKPSDTLAQRALRERMAQPESKELYQLRGQAAEWSNARARNWGMNQFRVRGLEKVRLVAVWFVLAANLFRAEKLRAEKRGTQPAEASKKGG